MPTWPATSWPQAARQLSADWERLYPHPIHLAETFIDPERFRGTCYRAANWTYLGLTTGRGKDDQTKRPNRSLKQLDKAATRRRGRGCCGFASRVLAARFCIGLWSRLLQAADGSPSNSARRTINNPLVIVVMDIKKVRRTQS